MKEEDVNLGIFCEPSPDISYVMMTRCEIDM